MKDFLVKFNLIVLICANIASQFRAVSSISKLLFFSSIALGCVSILFCYGEIFSSKLQKTAPLLFSFMGIILLYQLSFGLPTWSVDSWNYVFARCVSIIIVYLAVIHSYNYFAKDFMFYLSIIIAIAIVYGTITDHTMAGSRMYLGFGNPNSTSAIATVGFAGFLYSHKRNKLLVIMGLIISLWGILAGGSRTMTAITIIAVFLKYKVSYKTIILFVVLFFVAASILPYFGFNSIGIDRIINVVESKNFVGSREEVRKATIMMINENPVLGWGFKSGIQGGAVRITNMGSHNGYLDLIKSMGYPFAVLLFILMAKDLVKIRRFFFSKISYVQYHVFVVIAVLLGAMYESMLHGVNYLLNTLFFMSITILTLRNNGDVIECFEDKEYE